MNNRLAIGTVQFGLSYGIANHLGRVTRRDAVAILDCARSSGIITVDTAISYGESEQLLGELGVRQLEVVSKLPMIPPFCNDIAAWVRESVEGCLIRLRISKLHGLLLHYPKQILESGGIELYHAMEALKELGMVDKIGLSIYSPEELELIWPHFKFDLVQAPFNIIDRRLVESGWLQRLHQSGVEVHVRSIFLQGLLLTNAVNRPAAFHRWDTIWEQWHAWLDLKKLSPLEACVGFAISHPEIDRVVVGVNNEIQLREILAYAIPFFEKPPQALMSMDENLINPARWSNT